MMHFHNKLIFVFAILLLDSCGTEDRYGLSDNDVTYKLSVSVSGSEMETKFFDYGPDDTVNSLKLLVFDRNNQMILYEKTNTRYLDDVELPGKQKLTLYAVANSWDDFSNVRTLDDFLAMRSVAMYSVKDNLVMVGHVETILTENTVVNIPVRRMAAKVVIEYLEYNAPGCDNTDTHYPFNIFLCNIASDCPYSLEVTTPTYCVSARSDYPIGQDYVGSTSFKYKMIGSEKYYYLEEPIVMYAYPSNHNFTGHKPGLGMVFNGVRVEHVEPNEHINYQCYHWFTIRLPDLESNTLYRIPKLSIKVRDYGSENSDYSPYEIKAECRMETYDIMTGEMTGIQKMEAEVYEGDFEIQ